ncbi:glycosyltransferase family 4 protein [Seonamhaeicola sediminis]|uniref:Glycosyltransferase family 4 protein n=1 Tax=Seonamhaeicola sediminis TaxID=2528206 RepID=A0A562YI38_9FLAO|nr:glycosyltransferase family 4 protein [Seonamhaeicola sediminis]TWO34359.1 glycosyltransferase family 4 protein [Seonamhaeicola sediminis]
MKSILYIGNKLKKHGKNATGVEVLSPLLESAGYTVYTSSSKLNKFIRLIEMLWACYKYRQTVDMVLIDTYSTQNFYFAYAVSRLCDVLQLKYIPILHGGNLPKRLKCHAKLSKSIFRKAYVNVAPSVYMMEQFKSYGYKNLVYIPNAFEIKQYPFKKRDYSEIKLLWVRSFAKIYNPQLAVTILKLLRDEGLQASLCMVGPDSGDGSLESVRELAQQLAVEVTFTGKLTKPQWIALSKEYDIFINTTNFDNMPVSVIEAMALGLPVVSTNVGGMPYLIEDGIDGLLVNPNSVREFVKAIKYLLSNEEEAIRLTVKARKKVEQFDWNVVKKQWFTVLNN